MASLGPNHKFRLLQKRSPLVTAGLVALVVLAVTVGVVVRQKGHAEVLNPGEWNVECNVSHFAPDDPIVYPGHPGLSHMHSFYGNSTTNANSTTASLAAHDPTGACLDADLDNSAYWVPTIYHTASDGSAVRYDTTTSSNRQFFKAYYRRPGGANGPVVHPIPFGLRMIAGDSKATTPQDITHIYWDCGDEVHQVEPHNCGTGPDQAMRVGIRFPSCWDGVHLDSADHKSHMAYANETTGVCPADHPVSLPAIEYAVIYVSLPWDSTYYLSSGGIYSAHGDFWNAWDSRTMNAVVATCLNGMKDCDGMEYNSQTGSLANDQVNIKLSDFQPDPSPSVEPTNTPVPTPAGKLGDVNNDGRVDVFDLSGVLSSWGTPKPIVDINADGTVNIIDLSILLSHWGT